MVVSVDGAGLSRTGALAVLIAPLRDWGWMVTANGVGASENSTVRPYLEPDPAGFCLLDSLPLVEGSVRIANLTLSEVGVDRLVCVC